MSSKRAKQGLPYVLFVGVLLCVLFFSHNRMGSGITFIPAIPDPQNTLPSTNGRPDGCNSSRFTCIFGDAAVFDEQTGLTWARNAYVAGKKMSWRDAVTFCQNLRIGKKEGWRLPTRKEMISLLDTSQSGPALPPGHPFTNVGTIGCTYWTATEQNNDSEIVWIVKINLGICQRYLKTYGSFVWPVLDTN